MLKVWYLSEPMAAFIGRHTATKAEALAAVEKHILANNLVHQRKPHWIVCDETLRALLHRTKVTVTRIPKYVRKVCVPFLLLALPDERTHRNCEIRWTCSHTFLTTAARKGMQLGTRG